MHADAQRLSLTDVKFTATRMEKAFRAIFGTVQALLFAALPALCSLFFILCSLGFGNTLGCYYLVNSLDIKELTSRTARHGLSRRARVRIAILHNNYSFEEMTP